MLHFKFSEILSCSRFSGAMMSTCCSSHHCWGESNEFCENISPESGSYHQQLFSAHLLPSCRLHTVAGHQGVRKYGPCPLGAQNVLWEVKCVHMFIPKWELRTFIHLTLSNRVYFPKPYIMNPCQSQKSSFISIYYIFWSTECNTLLFPVNLLYHL